MRYVGVHVGHDSGVAVFDETGRLDFLAQCERYGERKKAYGFGLDPIAPYFQPEPDDIIVLAALAPNENGSYTSGTYDPSFDPTLVMRFRENDWIRRLLPEQIQPAYVAGHHFCHIASSWCFRTDDKPRFALAYDGAGHDPLGNFNNYLGGWISSTGFESVSIAPIPSSAFVANLLGTDTAGKAMGLAGYYPGEQIQWNEREVARLVERMCGRQNFYYAQYPTFWNDLTEDNQRFAAGLYKFWMEYIWNALELNVKRHASGGIVIGGGTTLALELNTRIYNITNDVVFGPAANDGGVALGAAAIAYWIGTKKFPSVDTVSQMHLPRTNGAMGVQEPVDIARLLSQDNVVGLLRARAELGPRALGYRSLLAEARQPHNLQRVSQDIKGREHYRPLAPIVNEDHFDRYFVGPKGYYMQYRVECTNDCRSEAPAIVHRDGSARPQVVSKEKDPWLYTLIDEYGKLTGVYCLINTSLNRAGKTIANTLQDALDDFDSKIHICSISNTPL